MVSLGSVYKVVSVGDNRFELHSQSRTFLFRAESTRVYLFIFSLSRNHLQACFSIQVANHFYVFFVYFTEERDDWVSSIEKILSDRIHSLEPRNLFFKNGSVSISFEGYLEMLSPRTKVYTLISRDKLFLFKSHEVWVWMWITSFLDVFAWFVW